MDWLVANWWQIALVVLGFLALRELRAATENIYERLGSLRDVKSDREQGMARREEFGQGIPLKKA